MKKIKPKNKAERTIKAWAVICNMKNGGEELQSIMQSEMTDEFPKLLNGIYPIFEEKGDALRCRNDQPVLSLKVVHCEIKLLT